MFEKTLWQSESGTDPDQPIGTPTEGDSGGEEGPKPRPIPGGEAR